MELLVTWRKIAKPKENERQERGHNRDVVEPAVNVLSIDHAEFSQATYRQPKTVFVASARPIQSQKPSFLVLSCVDIPMIGPNPAKGVAARNRTASASARRLLGTSSRMT